MVTQQQLQANPHARLHRGECYKHIGSRGGVKLVCDCYRQNGKLKTWVTRPGEFRLPVAHGLWDHSYVTQNNAYDWHLASECPIAELR